MIWLRTVDVGSVHTPLVGLHSRMGWDHPGPALFYAMAPILRLLDLRPTALLVGSLLIAMLSTALSLVFVFRRAGFGAGLVLAVSLLVLTRGLGDLLIDPWPPYIVLLPVALFTVATWLWSYGDSWMLPIAVVAGSFAAQTSIEVAALLLALAATALGLRVGCAPRKVAATERAPLLCSAILTIVLWTPPLRQQLAGKDGNLGNILMYFFGGHNPDPAVGWLMALRIAGREFEPWGPWLGFHNDPSRPVTLGSLGLLVLPLGLILIAAVAGRYFRDHLMLHLVIIVAVGITACIYSYANIHGPAFGYLVQWSHVMTMFCVALPFIILARQFATLRRLSHQGAVVPTAAVILIVLACQGVQSMVSEARDELGSRIYMKFWPAIERAIAPGETVRVTVSGPFFTVSSMGLAVMLIRAGRDPRLENEWAFGGAQGAGAHRVVDGNAVLPTLVLASSNGVRTIGQRANARLLASYDPLSPADRLEAQNLRDMLAQQLHDVGREDLIASLDYGHEWMVAPAGVDQNALRRFMSLAGGDRRRAYAVFLFPPTTW